MLLVITGTLTFLLVRRARFREDTENNGASPMADEKANEAAAEPRRVTIDYLKSNLFRVIHADGVVGGLTPRLDLHIDFWNERIPIPKQIAHSITSDGHMGEEIREGRLSRSSLVREVEVGIVMSVNNAKAFRDWLDERIREAEQIARSPEGAEG
jgi:hypothetical protein